MLKKFVQHDYNRENRVHKVIIEVPESWESPFEEQIKLFSPKNNQAELIDVSFEKNTGIFDEITFSFSDTNSITLTDIFVIFLCLGLMFLAIRVVFNSSNVKDSFQKNILDSRTNYNTVFNSNTR